MRIIQGIVDALSYLVGRIRGEAARQRRMYDLDQDKVRNYTIAQAKQRGMDTSRPWRELRQEMESEWREK